MQEQKQKPVNKFSNLTNIINEYSKKPHISKTTSLYPPGQPENEQNHDNYDQDNEYNYKFRQLNDDELEKLHEIPEKMFKYSLLQNISPKEFLEIKKEFQLTNIGYLKDKDPQKEIDLTTFVAIFLHVLFQATEYSESLKRETEALVEIYLMMDRRLKKRVTWDQVTDFLLELQEMVSRDETLFDTKLIPFNFDQNLFHNPLEKIFDYRGLSNFGVIENNLKYIRLIDPIKFKETCQLTIDGINITTSLCILEKQILVIATNDKYLNFYSLKSQTLTRRFCLPEVQTFLEYSPQKNLLYTTTHNKVIYSWDMAKILDKSFEEIMHKLDPYKRVIHERLIVDSQKELTSILNIDSHGLMVIGSNDCIIRLYKNNRELSSECTKLRGHTKGIKNVAFNSELEYLVSCAFDFDILIWNTYLDYPIAKLQGSEAPVIQVICPPSHKYLLISIDGKGLIKLWDLTNFNCLQTLTIDSQNSRIKQMIFLDKYNKLICLSKTLHVFQFDKSYNHQLADDKSISVSQYSKQTLEFYTASGNGIKCWDLKLGRIIRVFKNLTKGDITAMVLIPTYPVDQEEEILQLYDDPDKVNFYERFVFIGSTLGEIKLVDMWTGKEVRNLDGHHNKEISFLFYSVKYNILISGSQDKQIKIFNNQNRSFEDKQHIGLLRTIQNIYKNEITAAVYSDNLQLVATMGRDQEIRFWDIEKGQFQSSIIQNREHQQNIILQLQFLDPFPLIATSDVQGYIYIYGTKLSDYENQLLLRWKNMFTISKYSTVTQLKYTYNKYKKQLILVLGDETGYVRMLDITDVLTQYNIKEAVLKQEKNRNMYRFSVYNYDNYKNTGQNQQLKQEVIKPLPEKSAKQILQFQAHNQGIQDINVVNLHLLEFTSKLNILTIGSDKKIHLFNDKGNQLGELKQSETLLPNKNYLDGTNNNQFEPSQVWNIQFKKETKTLLENIQSKVKQDLGTKLRKRSKIRIQFKDSQQNNLEEELQLENDNMNKGMNRVSSEAIYKQLMEVDDYLNKKQNTQNGKYSLY